jgi:hypothetical protein
MRQQKVHDDMKNPKNFENGFFKFFVPPRRFPATPNAKPFPSLPSYVRMPMMFLSAGFTDSWRCSPNEVLVLPSSDADDKRYRTELLSFFSAISH